VTVRQFIGWNVRADFDRLAHSRPVYHEVAGGVFEALSWGIPSIQTIFRPAGRECAAKVLSYMETECHLRHGLIRLVDEVRCPKSWSRLRAHRAA
jgi:hypothetical protein